MQLEVVHQEALFSLAGVPVLHREVLNVLIQEWATPHYMPS